MPEPGPPSENPVDAVTLARRLGPAGVVAVLWSVLPLAGVGVLGWKIGAVTAFLTADRARGLAVYIAGFAVLAGLGLLPTWAQSLIGGWAFGFAVGGPAVVVAILAASWIGYEVARGASADRVEKVIREHATWAAVRDALVRAGFARAVLIVTLVRLPPNSPFAITNLVLASAGVPRSVYLLGTAIGITPRTLLTVFIGSTIGEMTREALSAGPPRWVIAASIVLALAAVAVIGSIARRAVERVVKGGDAAA
jgi:uncharacterized membrane protein YdjX (TVP38/TMEM64 family)